MKRKLFILIALCISAISLLALAACGHTHSYGEWGVWVEATCDKMGEKMRFCTCGANERESIDKTEHKIKSYSARTATCSQVGWEAFEACENCDYTTNVEIPMLKHDLQSHSAKATCSQDGWEAHVTCKNCDYSTIKVITTPMEHNYKDCFCTKCNEKEATFDALDFDYSDNGKRYYVSAKYKDITEAVIPSIYIKANR